MQITKIEPQKRHKNRSSVFLDGHFAFGMADFDLRRLKLVEGQELDEEDYDHIQNEVLTQEAKHYALKLLDRCPYTEKSLRRKLAERDTDETAIENAIAFLKEYNYIDDAEYARRYIKSALKTGKSGMRKIRYDLYGKGVDKETIEAVAAEIEATEEQPADESEIVLPLLEKKLRGDFSFPSIMKAKRYCISRGFSYEAIDATLRRLRSENDEW